MTPVLTLENLSIDYVHGKNRLHAVREVEFSIEPSQTLGLVGESGCGKSTLALAMMGLLPEEESNIPSGRISFLGQDITNFSKDEWRTIRGKKMAMIFQDPFSSLNPVLTIDFQLQEIIELEEGHPNRDRAIQLLEEVQLPDPHRILDSYPHQISGGQRQRVMIAMALARRPDLLIADEPTTALDVTVQDEIMELLSKLQKNYKMAMVFVTHNIGLIKDISDQLAVMYAGQIVEYGPTPVILSDPKHPYTQGLLRCVPKLKVNKESIPVLQGQPPELQDLPTGCSFHPRCDRVFSPCATQDPSKRKLQSSQVRCHLYESGNK